MLDAVHAPLAPLVAFVLAFKEIQQIKTDFYIIDTIPCIIYDPHCKLYRGFVLDTFIN